MKRKWVALALPLVLLMFLLGVKWRAEHPTPTQEDLEIREVIVKPQTAYLSYDPSSLMSNQSEMFHADLFRRDLKAYADWLYLLPGDSSSNYQRPNGMCQFEFNFPNKTSSRIWQINISLNTKERNSTCVIYRLNLPAVERRLHPITVKRWTDLLRNHPQIGPELRARMK